MKKKWKQTLTTLTISTIMGVSLFCTMPGAEKAHAAADIVINETNFPDEVFRNYVTDNFDDNNNGVLEEAEINTITEVDVDEMGISDLKGIEYFSNLRNLSCRDNNLTVLDISNNTALQTLNCGDNDISTLDVSHNIELTHLDCERIPISSLDVSLNTKLVRISCADDRLITSLDVSNNPNLVFLSVAQTSVNAIDVSHNPKLDLLFCADTNISSLDLTHNPLLTHLRCGKNAISEIDLSQNPLLKYLSIHTCQLTTLDVSNNPHLEELLCGYNQLTTLDVSNNPELVTFACDNNGMSSLDLSNNSKISTLKHWNAISAPLRKDGTGYSLDLSTFPLDQSKISSVSMGRYDSASGKIYLDTPLSVGDTVTYEYITGLADDTMTVTITISEVDPPVTTEQPASTSTSPTEAAATTENKSSPKTGDTTGPIGILILGLCSMAGMFYINKRTR